MSTGDGQRSESLVGRHRAGDTRRSISADLLACGHYWGVRSVPGMMDKSYYCHDCDRGSKDVDFRHHMCKGNRCPRCLQKDCGDHRKKRRTGGADALKCEGCRRVFYGEACLGLHRTRGMDGRQEGTHSVCHVLKMCERCGKEQDRRGRGGVFKSVHMSGCDCDKDRCRWCDAWVDVNEHRCMLHEDVDMMRKKERWARDGGRATKPETRWCMRIWNRPRRPGCTCPIWYVGWTKEGRK